jgi:hypothetical protein
LFLVGNRFTFLETVFGMEEPLNTIAIFFASVLLLFLTVHLIWDFRMGKILAILGVSVVVLAFSPVILLLFHFGEI